jgi:hypothetical protein
MLRSHVNETLSLRDRILFVKSAEIANDQRFITSAERYNEIESFFIM